MKKHSSYPVGQVSSAVLQAPESKSFTRQKLTWHVSERSVFIWSRLNWKLLKLQLTALTWLGVDDFSEVWTIFAPQPSSITLKVWLWVSEAITQSCKWNKTGNSSEKSSFHSTESELQILKRVCGLSYWKNSSSVSWEPLRESRAELSWVIFKSWAEVCLADLSWADWPKAELRFAELSSVSWELFRESWAGAELLFSSEKTQNDHLSYISYSFFRLIIPSASSAYQ